MDDLGLWRQNNDEYLAKSLAWLRLRLLRLAQQQGAAESAGSWAPQYPSQTESQPSGWWFWSRTSEKGAPTTPALLPPAPVKVTGIGDVTAEDISQAATEMEAAEAVTPPPALGILSSNLGLSKFEREILLLCTAMELDTRIASLCARAQDDPSRPYPTFALALALFDDPAWDALSPEGPLRHWRLIEISQPGAQPLTTSALRSDERIVNFLKGLNYLDDRLAPMLTRVTFGEVAGTLPPSHQTAVDTILRQLRHAGNRRQLPVVQLVGSDTSSKQMIASQASSAFGLQLYRLPVELLPPHVGELETLVRLIEREIALWPFALYLDTQQVETPTTAETQAPPLNRFLARSTGICFLDTQELRHGLTRPSVPLDIERPTQAEQQTAWAEALDSDSEGLSAELSGQFDLNIETIRRIAATAGSGDPEKPLGEQLWTECLLSVRPQLDRLAQRIEAKATWDDIVLPETEVKLLHQIADQVRQRGRVYLDWGFAAARTRGLSINALFAGESGTGKTMAAEVIANHLRLDLYRIDLSAVVNKYIGETEKNLRRVFDAAESGGVILFFDEADALFGRRSEVKDSHDRYANIEINYLLQRLEAYRGLAILATNMRSALDTAFMRRIRFIVEFSGQDASQRAAIWRRIFPPETNIADLDYARLAKLNLNGGSINNVAINAAFLAAEAGTPVTMPLVLDAARTELVKIKRPINDADFRWEEGSAAVA